jgi:predicted ATP-grasp superfamily ATP-dependent carboligase
MRRISLPPVRVYPKALPDDGFPGPTDDLAPMVQPATSPLRILLTEGASTSAREAVTALGLAGHQIEVADPDLHCICRFSRFVSRIHRCPPLATDPKGYLAFMLDLMSRGGHDVLLPIHEQGYLFAKIAHRLPPNVAVALPSFGAYATALNKASFFQLLDELGVPQPSTRFVSSAAEIPDSGFPFIVKQPMSTASRSVRMVRDARDLETARTAFGAGPCDLLVQDIIDGAIEHAQAVFDRGRLVAIHSYRQILKGAGGGEALKESVRRPRVRAEMEKIGRRLDWHGALSVDYLLKDEVPYFVDSNPRLVEPMSAHFAGLDLIGSLIAVSRGENPLEAPPSRAGVRTRLSLQVLLGAALETKSRLVVARHIWLMLTGAGPYEGSREEFTPVRLDWMAAAPVIFTALCVLAWPEAARILPERGWGAGLLTPEAIRIIRDEIG